MKFQNKLAALAAAILTTVSVCQPVAASMPQPILQETVAPRYQNISYITAYCEIENGEASFSGSYSAYADYRATLTITLQKSSNQVIWSDVTSTSKSYSSKGYHGFGDSHKVNSGTSYRCKVTVVINGETATCYSNIKTA